MDHEHLVLGECWYTIRYKRPLFVVRILEWGLRTRDIYNILIFSKIKKYHVRTQRSTPSYVIFTGSILPEVSKTSLSMQTALEFPCVS